MKKAILILAAISCSLIGMAQDKYVTSANVALNKGNFEEAKENIDKAMASPETKEKPRALFAKAQIYLAMQMVEKYRASNPYREGAQAVFKLVEVKPDYEKSFVDQMLAAIAVLYYNDGIIAYNNKKLDDASADMHNVLKVLDMKRFDKVAAAQLRQLDSANAMAAQIIALSDYYQGRYDAAIPGLTKVKANKITKSASIYECLIDALQHQGKKDEALAVIQEGRKEYPEDVVIRNYELNTYIAGGKQEELVKKLEEAASKEPNNADLQFNIATTYLNMANGTDGKKPANAAELSGKSEAAFEKAVRMAPDNAIYNYNFGALYFNQATEVNKQMMATPDADQKKVDALKTQRDELFAKALPYFEKARGIFAAGESTLKAEEKRTYKNTLQALMDIYSRLSKMDKYGEVKKKFDSM